MLKSQEKVFIQNKNNIFFKITIKKNRGRSILLPITLSVYFIFFYYCCCCFYSLNQRSCYLKIPKNDYHQTLMNLTLQYRMNPWNSDLRILQKYCLFLRRISLRYYYFDFLS